MKKKCKVIMLPTNKKANIGDFIIIKYNSNVLHSNPLECGIKKYNENSVAIEQHLYIVSDDTIEVGDWIVYYCHFDRKYKVEQVTKATIEEVSVDGATTPLSDLDGGKIIASTDATLTLSSPSQAFIESYCEKGGIDEVMVEYVMEHNLRTSNEDEEFKYIPKTNENNEILVSEVKTSWSREEIVTLISKVLYDSIMADYAIMPTFRQKAEFESSWIEKNL